MPTRIVCHLVIALQLLLAITWPAFASQQPGLQHRAMHAALTQHQHSDEPHTHAHGHETDEQLTHTLHETAGQDAQANEHHHHHEASLSIGLPTHARRSHRPQQAVHTPHTARHLYSADLRHPLRPPQA